MTASTRSATTATVALLCAWLVLCVFSGLAVGHVDTGDSGFLVSGTRVALDCLDNSIYQSCGVRPGGSSVAPFPLLQYVPAALLVNQGLADPAILHALARLSFISFIGVVAFVALGTRRYGRLVTLIAVVAVVASAASYHATSAFGEMFAALVITAAVYFALRGQLVMLTLAAVLVGVTREVSAIFVGGLLVVAVALGDTEPNRRRRSSIVALAALLGGLALEAAFNIFRYGTPRNVGYFQDELRTPGLGRRVAWTIGQWLSPTSGLLVFWPLMVLLLAAVTLVSVRDITFRSPLRECIPGLSLAAIAVAYSALLAAWYAPFGWVTYGPRLFAPIAPALVLLSVTILAERIPDLTFVLVRSWTTTVATGLVLAAAIWSQAAAPWRWDDAVAALTRPDATCPAPITIQEQPAEYFRCASHGMWRLHPSVIRSIWGGTSQVELLARSTILIAMIVGLLAARRASQVEAQDLPSMSSAGGRGDDHLHPSTPPTGQTTDA